MDTRRGAIVVGASLAALTAGWFIRRWYSTREHREELESAQEVQRFDEAMKEMNRPKRTSRRNTNGRHKVATN